jgi:hypothetical protein
LFGFQWRKAADRVSGLSWSAGPFVFEVARYAGASQGERKINKDRWK